ncbi:MULTISPECIES: hypothetical protein [Legionella]|uniref:Uncharacterized protein n=1 Tax=Legionella resiliens TaxID=2905958 RepID=A0ABS8WYY8_9GAMM|nr:MULTISPECIES: hypothetical protein [unclassified Legionella]MCE0722560.1 hypothetical protein [Legionella sp. 9fVS26]MCE3531713.1 hypothetical protein [Legionella sp. 8cVS16]QLZ67739.1 hypothetical protein FOLKNPGA_00512 [Legionella sp. PC1000]
MTMQNLGQFYNGLSDRLANKNYTEVRPVPPLDLAFLKQSMGGLIPKVIGVTNSINSTDSPATTFQYATPWFKKLLGNGGAGALVYIYWQPTATTVDEVMKLGSGMLGYGQVIAGVYDLFSNHYWMSDHMNWPQEIFH